MIPPIPCSLTPNLIFLPSGFILEKFFEPLISVLVDPVKSAEPPIKFGISSLRRFIDTPDEVFRNQVELNLTTAFQGAKAAAKKMSQGGSIINIASGAGMRGSPFTGPYAAAKAGMLNMNETLAIELAPEIRVNAISPGPVVTEMFAEVLGADGAQEEIASSIPLGFLGTPNDIASAVVFLSSPAARWVTGRNLLVAGGRTHRSYQYQNKLEED